MIAIRTKGGGLWFFSRATHAAIRKSKPNARTIMGLPIIREKTTKK